MNEIKGYIITLVLSLALIITGGIIYFTANDQIDAGIYFRRQYGFIGVYEGGTGFINLAAFNVQNHDTNFLLNQGKLSFGIVGVKVTDIQIEDVNQLREVKIIRVNLSIIMEVEHAQISHLVTSEGVFEFGIINLQTVSRSSYIRQHGVNSQLINDGLYMLNLGTENLEVITIKELIFQNDKIVDVELIDIVFPIKYQPGNSLAINLWLTLDLNYFDVFVIRPILRFTVEDQTIDSFFIPMLTTVHQAPMTYEDIRGVIRNVTT